MPAPPPKPGQATPALLSRRTFLAGPFAAGLFVATTAPLALYSNEVGRHELETTHRDFPIPNLPPAFNGFRIVQISDLHLEEYTEDFFLRHVIHQVNALHADLVLVTGDFISRGPLGYDVSLAAAGRCAAILGTLTCPERYGVLGNHDAIVNPHAVRAHMENNGLPILVNQNVRIERDNQSIVLAGIDDFSHGRPNLSESIPENPDAPVILMAHEPDFANRVATHERGRHVDLILSGHTHGGQIRIPGFRPLALPPLGRLYPEGHFIVGNSHLYVNRGIGTVGLPFRLNCPAEITVATLRAAAPLTSTPPRQG